MSSWQFVVPETDLNAPRMLVYLTNLALKPVRNNRATNQQS